MSTKLFNKSPYLRNSREFPEDAQSLSIELTKSYIDIASNVNSRTIGTYATIPTVTGNSWFTRGPNEKLQTIRQIYTFTAAGNIPHGIDTSSILGFVAIYGTFTSGSVWYPLPYVNEVAATNQVSLSVTSTNIVITAGAGSPPSISSGFVVLEWLVPT